MTDRLDTFAKRLATGGVSRRGVLGQFGAAGLGGALAAAFGPSRSTAPRPLHAAGAQASAVCVVGFEMTVRQGPSAGLALEGYLALQQDAGGGLADSVFVLSDGTQLAVTGQTIGRAINLLVDRGDGTVLYGVGTLENDLSVCAGHMGGPFVGPLAGDSGEWQEEKNHDSDGGGPLPQSAPSRFDLCQSCIRGCVNTQSGAGRSTCINDCVNGPNHFC